MAEPKRAMTLKTGRLSNDEQKIILDNFQILTVEELAKRLNRRVDPIQKFIDEHAPKITGVTDEDRGLINELHGKVYWRTVKEQFTNKEVEDFERYWVELYRQFNADVEFSEEMQIVDLVKLRLLADRNLYERNKARRELDELEEVYQGFIAEHGRPPYSDGTIGMQESLLMTQIRACETAFGGRMNEFKTILEKQQKYFEELKATRRQRQDQLKQSKKDWVSLMKQLQDEKKREKEGREVALMNLAAEVEKQRLMSMHEYVDGTVDYPILNDETKLEGE